MNEFTYLNSGIALNYIEGPKNGLPILLVHGNLSRWQTFLPIIPELTKTMHVFALDLRGHGKSAHVPGTYTLQNHLSDVAAFIKERIGSPVALIGSSLGGMIGLMAAAHYPELIRSVITADSPLTLKTLQPIISSQKELAHRVLHYLKNNQIEEVHQEIKNDFLATSLCLCDPDIITITFNKYEEMISEYNIEKLLPLIKCPVLMMRGEKQLGSMISDEDMEIAATLLPHLKQRKITGAGHSLLMNKETFLEIMEFLN